MLSRSLECVCFRRMRRIGSFFSSSSSSKPAENKVASEAAAVAAVAAADEEGKALSVKERIKMLKDETDKLEAKKSKPIPIVERSRSCSFDNALGNWKCSVDVVK